MGGLLARDWAPWLEQVSAIYEKLLDRAELPFHDNEQSSVSVLVGAAYLAGYVSMAEYGVVRGAGKFGRADMWFEAHETDYWFEFKRADAQGQYSLDWAMQKAEKPFGSASFKRGYLGYAGVIAATREMTETKRALYESFAGKTDLAIHVGPSGRRGAYLYFNLVRQP